MNQITELIFIGNHADASNHNLLKSSGITAVLDVAIDLNERATWTDGFNAAHCGLIDGKGNLLAAYYSAMLQLYNLVARGNKVMVHCHEGRSRAPSVVIAYLNMMDNRGWDYWQAFVKSKRPMIEPNAALREAFDKMDWDALKKVATPN